MKKISCFWYYIIQIIKILFTQIAFTAFLIYIDYRWNLIPNLKNILDQLYIPNLTGEIALYYLLLLIIISIIVLVIKFYIKKFICNIQYSIITYTTMAFFFTLSLSIQNPQNCAIIYAIKNISINFLYIIIFLLIFLVKLILLRFNIFMNYKFSNFPYDSKSKEDDNLGFSKSAESIKSKIDNIKQAVSVVSIDGGYGEGKSSLARMIVESFNPANTLYTFLSLTETNKESDFSKLFSERWANTIKERYPVMDIFGTLNIMINVMHEVNNDFLTKISKCLKLLNIPIVNTINKVNENSLDYKVISNTKVSQLFLNVNYIKENQWIILIDEIERGTEQEIFRVIEIVERFKNLSKNGFPVKVIFLLCVSFEEIEKKYSELKNNSIICSQVYDFLLEPSNKSIALKFYIPQIEQRRKISWIISTMNANFDRKVIADNEYLDILGSSLFFGDIYSSKNSGYIYYLSNEKDRLSVLIKLLSMESQRFILRVIENAKYFVSGKGEKLNFSIPDIIGIKILELKIPRFFEFLKISMYKYKNNPELLKNDIMNNRHGKPVGEKLVEMIDEYLSLDTKAFQIRTEGKVMKQNITINPTLINIIFSLCLRMFIDYYYHREIDYDVYGQSTSNSKKMDEYLSLYSEKKYDVK